MPYGTTGASELAIADAAVMTALLDFMLEKNLFTRVEVRGILAHAVQILDSRKDLMPVKGAIDIITDDLLPRFAEPQGLGSDSTRVAGQMPRLITRATTAAFTPDFSLRFFRRCAPVRSPSRGPGSPPWCRYKSER